MSVPMVDDRAAALARERELGELISAYHEATEQLKAAHERLEEEVSGLREELRRKNVELRRRERLAALGEMAAGLAHEIRNPLGGIALYASMLAAESAAGPKVQTAAGRISQAVRSLERLVSDILDFAQEHRVEKQACRLGEVLSAVEESVQPWMEEHGAAVEIDDELREMAVFCDPLRMRQVLLNLVMNGLQAAGRGGHVRVSAATKPARGVQLEVWDDGPGIPADKLDRIFNPFFTTRAAGTGLGLAIVHRIVEAHGGTVHAGNRPEGGARFVVRLPGQGGEA